MRGARETTWGSLAGGIVAALLFTSACLVQRLDIGPGQGGTAGSADGGGTGGAGTGGDLSAAGSGGNAGAGGTAPLRCEDFPIPPKSMWSVTASSSSLGTGVETDPLFNPAVNAVDDKLDDRWASGQPQEDGQWFHIDFGATAAISEVTLQQGRHLDDYPRGYAISLSYRHTDFDAAASATGHGASVSETVIPFETRAAGRYMMIRQTGMAAKWWTIAEINVACH